MISIKSQKILAQGIFAVFMTCSFAISMGGAFAIREQRMPHSQIQFAVYEQQPINEGKA